MSFRKQCEDRNSSADRVVGTNRKPTLPGRLSHLTQGERCAARGFCVAFPRRSGTERADRAGGERCREETEGQTWQQRAETH